MESFVHERFHFVECALEGLHGWEDDGAEMAFTVGLAEAGAVDDEDVGLLEEVEDVVFVGLPGSLFEGDFGEDVEGAVGSGGGDAGDFVEAFVGEVAAFAQLVVDHFDVVLWAA